MTGTNLTGSNLTIAAGNGTGTGGSGALVFQTAPAGSSGSTANTLTERFRISSAGNVGIGTSAPATILDLGGGTNYINGTTSYTGILTTAKTIQIYDATQSFLNLVSGVNTSGAVLGGIFFSRSLGQNDAHYNVAGITAIQNSTGTLSGGELLFYTKANSSPFERMRINSTGDIILGSGEASATTTAATLRGPARTGTDAAGSNLTIAAGNGTGTGGSGVLIFQTASAGSTGSTANTLTERMRISSSGNVGIGTTTLATTLNVKGVTTQLATGGEGGEIVFNNPDDATVGLYIDVSTADVGRIFSIRNNTSLRMGQLQGTGGTVELYTAATERMRIDDSGNVKIGGTHQRATTTGTNHLDIFNGTAPAGTLSNGISIYSSSGECYVMDASGNATLISPHDRETNEWIYDSVDTRTGKRLKIDMEKMMRFLNEHFGLDFVHDFAIDK